MTAGPLAAAPHRDDESLFPNWTSYVSPGASGGMYPLGLEAVGQSMIATHALPGITDATVHPRYFSFFAWTFAVFEERIAKRVPASQRAKAQRLFRARLENAFRSCTLANGTVTQRIIGSRGAFRFEGLSSRAQVQFPKKLPSGIDPANYGPSWVRLGLGYKKEGRMLTDGLGLELAAAFEKDLTEGMTQNERRALELLLDLGRPITVRVYEELTERFRVRSISPKDEEHAPLVEALFRLDGAPDREGRAFAESCRTRAHGLCLLLELFHQADGLAGGPDELYGVFARGRFADGRPVSLRDASIAETFSVWRRYMERQWQKSAVNAFWHETLNVIEDARGQPVPARGVVAHCLHLASGSKELRKFLGHAALTRAVSECLTATERRLPQDSGEIGALAMRLTDRIRDISAPGEDRIGCAVVLLFVSVVNWQRERAICSVAHRLLHAHGGPSRLSLPWMVEQVGQRAESTLTSLLEWVVEWCVLSQSMRVAYEKIDQGDRFFIHRVDGGYRLAQDRRDPRGYFAFDSSRLVGAWSLMRRLGLVGADGRVTRTGERIKVEALARWGE